MSGKEDTGGGMLLVEESEPQMDLELVNHEAQVLWDRAIVEMHQGNNLTASIELTWDNTSWRVASV